MGAFQIVSALILVAFIAYMWPNANRMLKESPKAESGDWHSVILPLVAVVGFVMFLIMVVRA
jgi:hypothetical protein